MVSLLLERDLERYFTKQCKALKLMTLKLNVRYNRGWPDRVVIFNDGTVIWVELKRPGGKLSALQSKVILELRECKQEVYVIDSKKGIDDVLATA